MSHAERDRWDSGIPIRKKRAPATRARPRESTTLEVPDRYLTTREVAVRLGIHIKTVLRYVQTAELPVCRLPGGDLRFAWPEVSEWLGTRKEAGK